ncbi:MAG: pyridoxamine 5'-phosphate oxidase family protein [Candidatus Saccharibacteria bacterium]|nr:pyridoxamine 5'-phosphate oxidase family protein [Candidatus Saccharibacteria bacterium]
MDNKSAIYDYLKSNKYMTLATSSSEGRPEAATVEYVMDGDELLINTYTYYRKYKNLLDNPFVACVITTKHDQTLQFDGRILLLSGEDAVSAKQKMLIAEPDFANFFNDNDTRFFKITPTWMRLRDYTKQPMKVYEFEINE